MPGWNEFIDRPQRGVSGCATVPSARASAPTRSGRRPPRLPCRRSSSLARTAYLASPVRRRSGSPALQEGVLTSSTGEGMGISRLCRLRFYSLTLRHRGRPCHPSVAKHSCLPSASASAFNSTPMSVRRRLGGQFAPIITSRRRRGDELIEYRLPPETARTTSAAPARPSMRRFCRRGHIVATDANDPASRDLLATVLILLACVGCAMKLRFMRSTLTEQPFHVVTAHRPPRRAAFVRATRFHSARFSSSSSSATIS